MGRLPNRWAPQPESPFEFAEMRRVYKKYRGDVADRLRLLWNDIGRCMSALAKDSLSVAEICATCHKDRRTVDALLEKLVAERALTVSLDSDGVAMYSAPAMQRIISKMTRRKPSLSQVATKSAKADFAPCSSSKPILAIRDNFGAYTDLKRNVSEVLSDADASEMTTEQIIAMNAAQDATSDFVPPSDVDNAEVQNAHVAVSDEKAGRDEPERVDTYLQVKHTNGNQRRPDHGATIPKSVPKMDLAWLNTHAKRIGHVYDGHARNAFAKAGINPERFLYGINVAEKRLKAGKSFSCSIHGYAFGAAIKGPRFIQSVARWEHGSG